MRYMKKKSFFALILSFSIVLSFAVSGNAQRNPFPIIPAKNDPKTQTTQKDPSYTDTKVDCSKVDCNSQNTGFKLQVRLKNPLKVDTIAEAIKLFMDIVLKIALPFIIVFFIWSGLKFILALGNPTKIKDAKNMFWYTIIGTLLILGAWTITNAIIGTVNALTG